jgi:hypothetical protein
MGPGGCHSLGRLAACVFGSWGPFGAAGPGRKQAGPAMEPFGPHRSYTLSNCSF